LYRDFTRRNQWQHDFGQSDVQLKQLATNLSQQLSQLQIQVSESDDVAALLKQADQLSVTVARNELTDLVRSQQADWQAKQKADIEHQEAKRQFEACQLKLKEMADDQGGLRLANVLQEIGSAAVLLDAEDERSQRFQRLTGDCDTLLRELNLPQFSVSEVVKLPLPTDEQVQRLEQQIEDSEQRLQQEMLKLDNDQARQSELQAQLEQLRRESNVPTQQDLQSARKERDETVNELVTVTTEQLAPAVDQVRQKINSADLVVDQMRSDQESATACSLLQEDLNSLVAKIQHQQQLVDQAVETKTQIGQQWDNLWNDRSIDSQSPAKMKQWLSTFASLLNKNNERQRAEQDHQIALRQIHDATQRLIDSMGDSEPTSVQVESEDPNRIRQQFQVIYDQAQERHATLSEIREQQKTQQAAFQQAETDLNKKRQSMDQASQRWQQWEQDWQDAVGTLAVGLGEASQAMILKLKPEAMLQHLEHRDLAQNSAKEIRRVQQEAVNLQSQVQHYDQQVTELTGLLMDQSDQPVSSLVRDLKQLIDQSLEEQRRASELDQDIKGLRKDVAKWNDVVLERSNQLEDLCARAAVSDPSDLDEVALQSQLKRKAMDSHDQIRRHLRTLAADLSVDAFVQHVHEADPDQIRASIDQLTDEMNQLKPAHDRALEERGARLTERDAIQGNRGAADLKQDYELQLSQLRDLSADYAKLSIAQCLLKQTLEHYRSEHQSPILALACSAFAKLTEGRYQGLVPGEDDKGNSVLYGERAADEALVPMGQMSQGTADAVFLALRIASIEHQLDSGVMMPVVIDDCLVQLDDQRAAAALKVLADLATRTQVVLFTHHQHLLELAAATLKTDQFHTHVL
jgi:FAD/FMN-containing dehydrogenase